MVVRPLAVVASLAVLVLLSGCTQAAVSNQTDHFSYSGQVAGVSDTKAYTWHNTVGKTAVSWGGQSASGTFTLTVKDAAGKVVYAKQVGGTQQGGVSDSSSSGLAGDWSVTLDFHDFTGQMGLSLDAGAGGANGYCPPAVPGC
jgi:hypothetical protein